MKIIEKKDYEDISIEEAKQYECCKNLNDEQITDLLETIRTFCEITYYNFAKKKEEQYNGNGSIPYNIAC